MEPSYQRNSISYRAPFHSKPELAPDALQKTNVVCENF